MGEGREQVAGRASGEQHGGRSDGSAVYVYRYRLCPRRQSTVRVVGKGSELRRSSPRLASSTPNSDDNSSALLRANSLLVLWSSVEPCPHPPPLPRSRSCTAPSTTRSISPSTPKHSAQSTSASPRTGHTHRVHSTNYLQPTPRSPHPRPRRPTRARNPRPTRRRPRPLPRSPPARVARPADEGLLLVQTRESSRGGRGAQRAGQRRGRRGRPGAGTRETNPRGSAGTQPPQNSAYISKPPN